MKTNLALAMLFSFSSIAVSAQTIQTCILENFNGQTAGWTYSNGASVGDYNNPAAGCVAERGIITPGVGGNNPFNLQTPEFSSTGTARLELSFDMVVLNANLKCNTWKDYPCQTSIDVYYWVNQTRYTGTIDQLLLPNGPGNPTRVSLTINTGHMLPYATIYKIEMNFKPKSGIGNCIQQNTKYVFDNFSICESNTHQSIQMERSANASTPPTINENTTNAVCSVYPAATNGTFKITANGDANTKSISLVDQKGNVIRSAIGVAFIVFNVKDVSIGNYYVLFEKNNGEQLKIPVRIN